MNNIKKILVVGVNGLMISDKLHNVLGCWNVVLRE